MVPTKFKRSLIAAIIAPALAAPAAVLAERMHEREGVVHEQSQVVPRVMEMRASELIGMDVVNREGEELGEIRDLVIDTNSGRVEYAALEHGGFLGMGEDLFAYPMRAFAIGPEGDRLVLDVSEERLEEREGFNDDNWPMVRDDLDYWANVDTDFGADADVSASAGATQPGARNLVRATELMDREIHSVNGEALGEIEDLVVSLEDGQIRHALVEREGGLVEEFAHDELDFAS